MKQNLRAIEHRIYLDEIKPIRDKLNEIFERTKEPEYKKYSKTPFNCVDCKKDIDGKFIVMQSFKNMDAWFSHDLDFTDFKIFCIKCWNKLSLDNKEEITSQEDNKNID